MRPIPILTLILATFLATAASAQQSGRVRAIEHPNFSRLIFEVEPGSSWTLDTISREADLVFPGRQQRFDAASVFDRISRSRILSLAQTPSGRGLTVTLKLGCDCEVKVSEIAPGRLALDVLRQGANFGSAGGNPAATTVTAPGRGPAPETPEVDLPETEAAEMAEEMTVPEAEEEEDLSLAGSVAEEARLMEEARLLEQEIMRIAGAGLLDPDETAEPLNPAEPASGPGGSGLEPFIPTQPPSARTGMSDLDNSLQTRVDTALDATITFRRDEQMMEEAECRHLALSPDFTDDAPTDVAGTIGSMRNALIRIDGSVDEAAWRDLAHYYVSIGFGVEAVALLDQLSAPQKSDAVMQDIARILEGAPPETEAFADTGYCSGRLTMWRLAAGRSMDAFDQERLMEELAALPVPLRKPVGLKVIDALTPDQAGLAERIKILIERSPRTEVPPSEAELVDRLEERAQELSEAMTPALDADDGAGTPTDEAADTMAEPAMPERHGARVDSKALELDLGIAAREMNGTAPGLEATITLAEVQAVNGEVLHAIELLNSALEQYEFGSGEIYAKGTEILLQSSEREDLHAQFVLAALAGRKFVLSVEHQQRINTRIAELGLPNLTVFR